MDAAIVTSGARRQTDDRNRNTRCGYTPDTAAGELPSSSESGGGLMAGRSRREQLRGRGRRSMRRLKWLILVAFAAVGTARIPSAVADTESMVTCKDGTTSKGGKGACSHHGGVASGAAAPAPGNAPAAKPSSTPPAAKPSST